ncbi:MAG: DUF5658 family protein [Planctomycetes bacterium]|nr:DUF5658 family protein [Planctomycetota bacterium]
MMMMASANHQDKPRPAGKAPAWLNAPPMRYQEGYVWFLFFASVDIMLTWHILRHGGTEVNPVARLVLEQWELAGAVAFKFSLVLFVIVACEIVGRHEDKLGRRLTAVAIATSAFPVFWSLTLLVMHGFLIQNPPA